MIRNKSLALIPCVVQALADQGDMETFWCSNS